MDFLQEAAKRIEAADEAMVQSLNAYASGNDAFLEYLTRKADEAKARIDARNADASGGSSGEDSGIDAGTGSGSSSSGTGGPQASVERISEAGE